MPELLNITVKGVEEIDGRWYAFVERHEPCVDPYGLHQGCTIVQRALSPAYRNLRDAEHACELVEVVTNETGEVLKDWDVVGS